MLRRFGPLLSADTGAGEGGAAAAGTDPAQPPGDAGQQQPGGSEKTFTQAELDRIVSERLERARKQAETLAERARTDAAAKTLAEQGEFKTLAEQHAARIAELESQITGLDPVKAQAARYEAALKTQLSEARKDLPAHILSLLDKMDVAEQLEYLAANRAALIGTPQTQATKGRGTPQGQQRPAGQQQADTTPPRKPLVRF